MTWPLQGTIQGSIRDRVPDAEWQQRVDLAAAYRLASHYRMTDQIYTHLTAKVPAGTTIRETFELLYYLERGCETQIRAQAGGVELVECSDEVAERVAQALDRPGRSATLHDWPALRRLVDRIDPSYAD